jgi:hypothetical protein
MRNEEGFSKRIFLTEAEHETYKRRPPVRYIKHKKDTVCCVCGLPAEDANQLENAHVIGFLQGVLYLGLTPDFLDRKENIKTAHRIKCNAKVQLSLEEAAASLAQYPRDATYQ